MFPCQFVVVSGVFEENGKLVGSKHFQNVNELCTCIAALVTTKERNFTTIHTEIQ
jgi:hypothetical protein